MVDQEVVVANLEPGHGILAEQRARPTRHGLARLSGLLRVGIIEATQAFDLLERGLTEQPLSEQNLAEELSCANV